MLSIALIDARWQIIPNELNAAALTLALPYALIQNPDAPTEAIATAALRGGALAMLFLVLRLGYQRWRAREGIGLGDVKLAGVAGAWLDWPTIPIAIEIAALSALAAYGVRHYWLGRKLCPTTRLPFGLFFAPAIWLGWLLETTVLVVPHRSPLL
jgi:leader peptidase (prepilin peptidase)/N-methyltransferase